LARITGDAASVGTSSVREREKPFMRDHRVAREFVRPFGLVLRQAGIDPIPLARSTGLIAPKQTTAPALLTLESVHRFCDRAADLTHDDHIALRALALVPGGALGVLEFGVHAAPTLGAAVQLVAQYHQILRDPIRVRLDEGATSWRLTLSGLDDSPSTWVVDEFEVSRLIRLLRSGGPANWSPGLASFSHPAPVSRTEPGFVSAIGAKVRFGSPCTSLEFRQADAALPNPNSDPPLFDFLRQQADQALDAVGIEAVPEFIRERLVQLVGRQAPDLDSLAASLRMSNRTLQRRLAAGGQSFQSLTDSVRQDMAKRLLEEGRSTVSDISRRLGYTTPRSFLRAFQRWTHTTPRRWRLSRDVLR